MVGGGVVLLFARVCVCLCVVVCVGLLVVFLAVFACVCVLLLLCGPRAMQLLLGRLFQSMVFGLW